MSEKERGALSAKLDGVIDLVSLKFSNQERTLKEIICHVEKTNGRVKALEIWKAYLIGGWVVLSSLFTLVVLPLVFYYIKSKYFL